MITQKQNNKKSGKSVDRGENCNRLLLRMTLIKFIVEYKQLLPIYHFILLPKYIYITIKQKVTHKKEFTKSHFLPLTL